MLIPVWMFLQNVFGPTFGKRHVPYSIMIHVWTSIENGELSPSGESRSTTADADPSVEELAKCVVTYLWETTCPILEADPSMDVC
jgi:hypothetical protein